MEAAAAAEDNGRRACIARWSGQPSVDAADLLASINRDGLDGLSIDACQTAAGVEYHDARRTPGSFVDPGVTRPGRMAAAGLAATEGCGIAFLACAAVMVPIGAAIGAVITAASTLPERTAYRLNIVTANVRAGLNLDASFEKAMREEASRQGIVLTRGYADARLDVVMTRFRWDVGVGNSVAIRIDFEVTGFADGKRGHRNITYISERAKVSEWIADSGKRIRQELMMDEASQTIWQKVLDRD